MLYKLIAKSEAFMKGMMFDCHECGQCVLSKTGLICPMSCPKGLRNGPCGGTLEGLCEVYPDRQCVWVRIHRRTGKGSLSLPQLIASPDSSLFYTSSYLNFLKGTDQATRRPLQYLDLPKHRVSLNQQTQSALERKLKSGQFVQTCEIRSPRNANFKHMREQALLVRGHFDAVNATAYLNGKPSLSSPITAGELRRLDIEPISQATCRDHTKTSFVSEMIQNQMNQVYNTLCLTGDAYVGEPKIKQVFDMDSSLMLYEARYLRDNGKINFTQQAVKDQPKPFLGAAINPFTTPANVPIRRLKQKAACGADFIQTQLIFDIETFKQFMATVCQEKIHQDLFILAGVPVVISQKAMEMLPHVPGVQLPKAMWEKLQSTKDLRATGIEIARDMIKQLKQIPGVSGVHLMLFGSDHKALTEVVQNPSTTSETHSKTSEETLENIISTSSS